MYEWAYRFSFISIQYEIVTSILFLLLDFVAKPSFFILEIRKKLICGIQNRFNLLIRKDCFEIHTIIFY